MNEDQIKTLKSFMSQNIRIALTDPATGHYRRLFIIKEHEGKPTAFFRDGSSASLLELNAEDFCILNIHELFQN